MKESKLIEMRNKIEALGNIAQQLIYEVNNLKDLSIGTLETLKRMEGYETALERLKEEHLNKKENVGEQETESDPVVGEAS